MAKIALKMFNFDATNFILKTLLNEELHHAVKDFPNQPPNYLNITKSLIIFDNILNTF